jgi:hypothetical protein
VWVAGGIGADQQKLKVVGKKGTTAVQVEGSILDEIEVAYIVIHLETHLETCMQTLIRL